MDTATGKWLPCARVKDCHTEIKGLKKGQAYHFRVKAVNKEGQSEPLQTDKETVAKNPYDPPGRPSAPDIVDWDAKKADLQWEPPKNVRLFPFFYTQNVIRIFYLPGIQL